MSVWLGATPKNGYPQKLFVCMYVCVYIVDYVQNMIIILGSIVKKGGGYTTI